MARSDAWSLTFRHGPKVDREYFDGLDEAVEELERRVEAVRSEGPLDTVKMFREYEPSRRVHARGELSRGGIFRSRTAGVDLMGDGSRVPYKGSVRRRTLDVDENMTPYEAVREALKTATSIER